MQLGRSLPARILGHGVQNDVCSILRLRKARLQPTAATFRRTMLLPAAGDSGRTGRRALQPLAQMRWKGTRAADGIGSLKGKTVAVTGGTGGIGYDIMETLLKYECNIVVIGRQKSLDELEKRLGNRVRYVPCDLMDADACSKIGEKVGVVDHLVNSAGIAKVSPLMEQTAEDWDQTLNVNGRAVFLVSQSFARQWIKEGKRGCSICNISSQASQAPLPGHLTYCASKAAVDMITRMMAMELGPNGIRVNSVNPTVVLTAMGKENWSDPAKAGPMLSGIPVGRFAEPEEVSEVVAWLLSDGAAMVNGVQIPIDGGFLATRMNLMPKE